MDLESDFFEIIETIITFQCLVAESCELVQDLLSL